MDVTDLDIALVEGLFVVVAFHRFGCNNKRLIEIRNKIAPVPVHLHSYCALLNRTE